VWNGLLASWVRFIASNLVVETMMCQGRSAAADVPVPWAVWRNG